MSAFEVRYRGQLLSRHHETMESAEAHAREHHGYGRASGDKRPDHHVEDVENLTIEPARPVHLYCRGNLVDTFLTEKDAHERRVSNQGKLAPESVWLVVDTTKENLGRALERAYAR